MTRSRRLARAVASLGPLGRSALAPGTVGSAAAVLSGALLMRLSPSALPIAVAASVPVGWASLLLVPETAEDPGWVVIDEVAGQWIAMLGLERGDARGLLAAFVLFRLLDITKPGPVGWADRKRGAAGVMLDDIVAGGIAASCLMATRWIGRRR